MPGGESSVIELLENQSKKQPISKPLLDEAGENRIEQHKSLRNFFFRPSVIGKDLLAIEKFGLVQYVSHFSIEKDFFFFFFFF